MKAIFYNIFGLGHINPTLPLVKRLVEDGVEVIYHTSPERKDLVESVGATFRNYGRDDYQAADYNPGKNFVQQTLPAAVGLLPFLREEFERERPDFIIYDSMAPWGLILSQLYRVPAFCSVTTFALNPHDKAEIFAANGVECDEVSRGAMETLSNLAQSPIPFHSTLGAYNDCNIVFAPRGINPSLETPAHFHFVNHAQTLNVCDFPFEKILNKPRQVILMALGTIIPKADPSVFNWYRALVNAFGGDDDYWVILGVGTEANLEALGALPSNVIAQVHVPQKELLKHAHVFINHGGMNSITEGLKASVPMLVIPHSFDQHLNAKQVNAKKVGLMMKSKDVKPSTLKNRIQILLGSPIIHAHLQASAQAGSLDLNQTMNLMMKRIKGTTHAVEDAAPVLV